MTGTVDLWSCPTTVCAGGLAQLPMVLAGRRMLLIADGSLAGHVDSVLAYAAGADVVLLDAGVDAQPVVDQSLARHPDAVPVALGGGSVMDVVRLAMLALAEPATSLRDAIDGPAMWPTRFANPTICLPSTIGTAAEVSPIAVRATGDGTAMLISPGLRSAAAVIDASITGSLPTHRLVAGLVEPLARVLAPAIAGTSLMLQDSLARALAGVLLDLGDTAARGEPDAPWRRTAALTSLQTHTSLLAIDRPPAGHALWPLATELTRATGLPKAPVLAALLPAWLRGLAEGSLGPAWGSAERTRAVLGLAPSQAAIRVADWLTGLGLGTTIALDVGRIDEIVGRVIGVWRASGLFLAGATATEIAGVLEASIDS